MNKQKTLNLLNRFITFSLAALISVAGTASAEVTQQSTSYTYTADGQVDTVDGPRTDVSDITDYDYDAATKLLNQTTYGQGEINLVEQFQNHTGRGDPQLTIGPNGVATVLSYHPRGWLTQRIVKDPSDNAANNAVARMQYDPVGQVTCQVSPEGTITLFQYSDARYLTGIVEGADNCDFQQNTSGFIKTLDYDIAGNITTESIYDGLNPQTDPLIYQSTQNYDELSRVRQTHGIHSANNKWFEYDGGDNVVLQVDSLTTGGDTRYTFLGRNNLGEVRYSMTENTTTNMSYDSDGNIASVTDDRGNTTHYTYDSFGNVVTLDSPDSGVTHYEYDAADNLVKVTDGRQIQKNLSYDALNRLTQVTFPAAAAENISYFYDNYNMDSTSPDPDESASFPKGRLTGINSKSQIRYYYDHRGNVTKYKETIAGHDYITRYAYNLDDQITQMSYPSGRIVNYQYGADGKLRGMTTRDSAGATEKTLVSNANHLPFGPLNNMTYGNGLQHTRGYDANYRLSSHQTQGNVTVEDMRLNRDLVGNVRAIENLLDGSQIELFDYDKFDRLLEGSGPYGEINYTYDTVGNRLTKTHSQGGTLVSKVYTYADDSNRLINDDEGITQYDGAGNAKDSGPTTSLAYNHANRHILAAGINTDGTGFIVFYHHNALGQRIEKQSGSDTEYYHYNTAGALVGVYDANHQVKNEYIYFDGEVIAVVTRPTITNVVSETVFISSEAANDGWIKESSTTSSAGGTVNVSQNTDRAVRAGDDKQNREFRGRLLFDIGLIPAELEVISATLTLKRNSSSIVGSGAGNISVKLLPSAGSVVSNSFQQTAIAAVGSINDGSTATVNFSTESIDAINAARANGEQTVSLRLEASALTNDGGNDYTGYFSREYSDSAKHPKLAVTYGIRTTTVGNPQVIYALNDHLGTTRRLIDENQDTVWSAQYLPFGEVTTDEDPDGNGEAISFALRFPGQYYDSETGLHYNYFRTYDPALGRYLSSDPLGLIDGPNTYAYVGGNPVNFSDPRGLSRNVSPIDHLVYPPITNTDPGCKMIGNKLVCTEEQKCRIVGNKRVCTEDPKDKDLSCKQKVERDYKDCKLNGKVLNQWCYILKGTAMYFGKESAAHGVGFACQNGKWAWALQCEAWRSEALKKCDDEDCTAPWAREQ